VWQLSLRDSAIGTNCKIGSRVKIHNCILMDNVCVQDGWALAMPAAAP
jgi:ADP-glucose pyrophosphorylase